MQWWWLFAVAVYFVVGALLGRRAGQPSSFFQAILIIVLWILFWPLMLLFMHVLGIIWPEDGARNGVGGIGSEAARTVLFGRTSRYDARE
jgi:hypothetical protein